MGKCAHLLHPYLVHNYGTLNPTKGIRELTGWPGIVLAMALLYLLYIYIRHCVDAIIRTCILVPVGTIVYNCVRIVCYYRNVDVE